MRVREREREMTFMESMDDQLMFVSSILRRSVAVILILLHLIWSCNNSAAAELYNENAGGFPSVVMSNSSSTTGISLLNGKLRLDSTNANLVYALFPYIPFNTSAPSMGSFNTLFNFTNIASVGALGIIAINPNSDIMKLEDQLLAITNLPYELDTKLVNNSNYLALVCNFTVATLSEDGAYVVPRFGGGPVMYFDHVTANEPDNRAQNFNGELQYFDPASVSKACASIPTWELPNTLCPENYMKFGMYNPHFGYSSMSFMAPHSNLSVLVSSLVGFFAFGRGVFDVTFWEFTDLYIDDNVAVGTSETICNASFSSIPHPTSCNTSVVSRIPYPSSRTILDASVSSIPYPSSILNLMLFFLSMFFYV